MLITYIYDTMIHVIEYIKLSLKHNLTFILNTLCRTDIRLPCQKHFVRRLIYLTVSIMLLINYSQIQVVRRLRASPGTARRTNVFLIRLVTAPFNRQTARSKKTTPWNTTAYAVTSIRDIQW